MAEKYKLTYFNVKALAEPIRLILSLAEVEFEDCRIEKADWCDIKQNYQWGQLPVLEFGDKKLSQSSTIARYLARKYKLAGSDEWESAKIDELVDVMSDIRSEWRKFFMEQDVEKKAEMKQAFLDNTVAKYFPKLETIKKENGGKFMVGTKISWGDLLISHYMEFFELTLDPAILDNYPELKALKQNVYEIPAIKAWIEKRPETAM